MLATCISMLCIYGVFPCHRLCHCGPISWASLMERSHLSSIPLSAGVMMKDESVCMCGPFFFPLSSGGHSVGSIDNTDREIWSQWSGIFRCVRSRWRLVSEPTEVAFSHCSIIIRASKNIGFLARSTSIT